MYCKVPGPGTLLVLLNTTDGIYSLIKVPEKLEQKEYGYSYKLIIKSFPGLEVKLFHLIRTSFLNCIELNKYLHSLSIELNRTE